MIYTNSKIKQSNGPGVECQRFLLSSPRKEATRKGTRGRVLGPEEQLPPGPEYSRLSPAPKPESRGDSERPLQDPKAVTNSRGALFLLRAGKQEKVHRHIATRDKQLTRRTEGALPWPRPSYISHSFFPNCPCFTGTLPWGGRGEQLQTQPTGNGRLGNPAAAGTLPLRSPGQARQGTQKMKPTNDTSDFQSKKNDSSQAPPQCGNTAHDLTGSQSNSEVP